MNESHKLIVYTDPMITMKEVNKSFRKACECGSVPTEIHLTSEQRQSLIDEIGEPLRENSTQAIDRILGMAVVISE